MKKQENAEKDNNAPTATTFVNTTKTKIASMGTSVGTSI